MAGESERRWCEEAIVLQRGSATGKGTRHQGRVWFCFNMGDYFSIYECDDAEESAAMLERSPQVGGRRGDPGPWGNGWLWNEVVDP